MPYFWIPEETIPQRVKANSVPYDVWEKQGYLLATEGNVIHYDFIEKFICDLGEKYHILEIAVDRWNATHMIQNLEDAGFTMVPFGQGFASMSTPTKEFYRLLMELLPFSLMMGVSWLVTRSVFGFFPVILDRFMIRTHAVRSGILFLKVLQLCGWML